MNDQHLQQILTLQQALATAAAAAVINSLLNPQQAAANLAGQTNPAANSITQAPDASNDLASQQQQLQQLAQILAQHQQQQHQQQQQQDPPQQHQQQHQAANHQRAPANSNSPQQQTTGDCGNLNNSNGNRIQDILLQLQQQAALGASPLANLNLNHLIPSATLPPTGLLPGSPARSPISNSSSGSLNRLNAQSDFNNSTATTSNIQANANLNQISSIKKLKRHHHHHHHHQQQQQQQQQQQHISPQSHANNHNQFHRSALEATSKPQPLQAAKSHHSTSSAGLQKGGPNSSANNTSSSSASSAFLPNNVGLPRKLVRGQDVWLGRGAEQTRQILKCMWCGQSFRTLAEMTQHMKVTQHYTNIISQEQITSWKQPDQVGSQEAPNQKHQQNKQGQAGNLDDNIDDLSEKFHDSDREGSFSNDDEAIDSDHNHHNQSLLGNESNVEQRCYHSNNPAEKQSNQARNRQNSGGHLTSKQSEDSAENSNAEFTTHDDASFSEATAIKSPPTPSLNLTSSQGSATAAAAAAAAKHQTRSRKRENVNETSPKKSRPNQGQGPRDNSPNSSSPSSLNERQNSRTSSSHNNNNPNLSALNQESESANKLGATVVAPAAPAAAINENEPADNVSVTGAEMAATPDSEAAAADEDLAIKQVIKKMLDAGGKMNGDLNDESNLKMDASVLVVEADAMTDYANDSRDKISNPVKKKKRKTYDDQPAQETDCEINDSRCKSEQETDVKDIKAHEDEGNDKNSNEDYPDDLNDEDNNDDVDEEANDNDYDELGSEPGEPLKPTAGATNKRNCVALNMANPQVTTITSAQTTTPTNATGQRVTGCGGGGGQKGDSGDPLSALETMVEKSFDPRLRPGVATGGILQRLGIDEEVCPPWQHINYANWYAAAAYGHPMAAALLAAGINLQNGIKLSKNMASQKKSDDD